MALVMLLWSAVFTAALLYAVYKIFHAFLAYVEKCRIIMHLPGAPPRFWILGNLMDLPRVPNDEFLNILIDRTRDFPRIAYAFLGPIPTVGLIHPETAKEILKTSEPKPRTLAGAYNFLLPWLGEGLLVAGGRQWARNRKLLTPAFHFDILKPYVKINNQCTDILVKKLEGMAEKGEYFEAFRHISYCTFDIILRCAFSYTTDCQMQGEGHPYLKAVSEMSAILPERMLNPLLYPDWVFALSPLGRRFKKHCNFVHKVADDVIKARKKSLAEEATKVTDQKYLDFLDILLTAKDADGKGLTDKEIRQEVDTFLFEGHDTTASGITWTLYSLASNPECMKKCQEEIDALLADRDTDEIQWTDIPHLKYLSMCVKEGLRMHAPVPYIQRITTKDCYIDGFLIPKDTNISIVLHTILHHPDVWEKPMEFIPERFSPEKTDTMGSHSFVPFSAGPRNCIGQHFALHEMKVVIARLLRRFDFEVKPDHKVVHIIATVMKAENGIYLRAKPRKIN